MNSAQDRNKASISDHQKSNSSVSWRITPPPRRAPCRFSPRGIPPGLYGRTDIKVDNWRGPFRDTLALVIGSVGYHVLAGCSVPLYANICVYLFQVHGCACVCAYTQSGPIMSQWQLPRDVQSELQIPAREWLKGLPDTPSIRKYKPGTYFRN